MEEQGKVRRGYFVAGLGAAQFAKSGCGRPAAHACASQRGAEPPWCSPRPIRPSPTAPRCRGPPSTAARPEPRGEGRARRRSRRRLPRARWAVGRRCSRSGRADEDGDDLGVLVAGLGDRRRSPRIEVATVDGTPVAEHPLGMASQAGGWRLSYRGLRPPVTPSWVPRCPRATRSTGPAERLAPASWASRWSRFEARTPRRQPAAGR